jgi:hypothetical protein
MTMVKSVLSRCLGPAFLRAVLREHVISTTLAVLIGLRPTRRRLLSVAAAQAAPEGEPPAPR